MATALTNIFGSEICVTAQPQVAHRQFIGFPGANGLTSIHLGTRGRLISITGRLRASGGTYAQARAALLAKLDAIDELRLPDADVEAYTYHNKTYYDCLLDTFELLRDANGRAIHLNSKKECFCDFAAILVSQR
ncbi:MAG: hypothetical protein WCZ89_02305 [Phycisphaerae bacterium]